MSRPVCGNCMCLEDETGCGCVEMKQEPVAYWDGKHFASKDKSSLADIPLYTHPHKELSKDDIYALAKEFNIWLIPEDVTFVQFVLQRSKQ